MELIKVTQKKKDVHTCSLKPYGDEEMKCEKCGYVTYRNDKQTTQQIIGQMVKNGYPKPKCDNKHRIICDHKDKCADFSRFGCKITPNNYKCFRSK